MTPPISSVTSYATSGGRLRDTTTRTLLGIERREHRRLAGGQHEVERRQGHRADDGDTTDGEGDVHRPVAPVALAELAGAVERVDDPEPALACDVLESFLRAHLVLGIEAGELVDEKVMGQVVTGCADVPHGWWRGTQLQEGSAGGARQDGRVAVLGGKVLGHGALF